MSRTGGEGGGGSTRGTHHGGLVLLLQHLVHGLAVLPPEVEALRLQPRRALQPPLHQLR